MVKVTIEHRCINCHTTVITEHTTDCIYLTGLLSLCTDCGGNATLASDYEAKD